MAAGYIGTCTLVSSNFDSNLVDRYKSDEGNTRLSTIFVLQSGGPIVTGNKQYGYPKMSEEVMKEFQNVSDLMLASKTKTLDSREGKLERLLDLARKTCIPEDSDYEITRLRIVAVFDNTVSA